MHRIDFPYTEAMFKTKAVVRAPQVLREHALCWGKYCEKESGRIGGGRGGRRGSRATSRSRCWAAPTRVPGGLALSRSSTSSRTALRVSVGSGLRPSVSCASPRLRERWVSRPGDCSLVPTHSHRRGAFARWLSSRARLADCLQFARHDARQAGDLRPNLRAREAVTAALFYDCEVFYHGANAQDVD